VDLRLILLLIGIMLTALGSSMLIPAAADLVLHNFDWHVFTNAASVCIFCGVCLMLTNRHSQPEPLTIRQAYLLTASSWLALAFFAALPFAWSNLDLSFTDAFFEAMSGLTTTGATVLTGPQLAPVGILLWRAILQWLGGIGIIVTAVALLPLMRIGGMQLFHTESSDRSQKARPTLSQVAASIVRVYIVLTLLCVVALQLAGMSLIDAVAHAMSTISTGGFSTSDVSIGHFDSAAIEMIVMVFMLLGAITFTLYVRLWHGQTGGIWHDSQVRWFLGIVTTLTLALAGWLVLTQDMAPLLALRRAAFNVVSIITTTGFASDDYSQWGTFAIGLFFLLTFVGGCTGSTSGGIKIFRFEILYLVTRSQLRRILYPHGVFPARYQGRPISIDVQWSVIAFVFLFGASFAGMTLVLTLAGLDFVTSASGAAAALANVGPGLGELIGPAGNFASLPSLVKWVLAFGMLLGRLELITLLILVTPAFWVPGGTSQLLQRRPRIAEGAGRRADAD
jgi:trk system potassium uptake protein TrkH